MYFLYIKLGTSTGIFVKDHWYGYWCCKEWERLSQKGARKDSQASQKLKESTIKPLNFV